MSNYTKCPNGHLYPNTETACPYCPSGNATNITQSNNLDKTSITVPNNGGGGTDLNKTQITGGNSAGGNLDATQLFGSQAAPAGEAFGKPKDLNRTFIQTEEGSADGTFGEGNARPSRKITAWLISYTIDPMGVDFRIYEGTNTIGRDPENTISITEDHSISSKHVSLLCRKDRFYLKDEMTANGTFINDVDIEIGIPYELKDGDKIKIGSTILKFRTAI
ncbi:FHA domain-containing protein [Aquirufa sp.]|jgi:hypothetical protein|uniref:FHA domain-containing protein n=1 Tax=Aquirufa sp. TaxID=2676249 RepID=UPI0037C053D7